MRGTTSSNPVWLSGLQRRLTGATASPSVRALAATLFESKDSYMKETGVVRYWNVQKFYGFISFGDLQSAFFHGSWVQGQGVGKGDRVSFELKTGPKG